MLLVYDILTHVLFIFNFRYYDNHFLVCGTGWIKTFGFSRLFLLHRQSSVADLTHYVVAPSGKYFLMGKSSGAREENLIPCEQVSWERNCCQGGLGFNQNEWALRKSWNSLLEQLRNICIQLDLPFLKWGVYFDNTSAIQKYLKIPISNYFKCFLLPIAKMAVKYNNSFCKGSWSSN